ncbi:MAG: M28 family peptidase [Gemmatimonadaceae bacterium]
MRRSLLLFPIALVGVLSAALPRLNDTGSPATLAAAVRALVTPARLEQHSRRIVEHERLSGSPGENAAIDYIVATLRADGVPFEIDTIRAYASDPISATVELLRTDGSVDLTPKSITVAFSHSVTGLDAPLVDVGDARNLPELDAATGAQLGFAPDGSAPVREVEPTPGTNRGEARPTIAPAFTREQLQQRLRGAIALVTGTPGPEDAWKLQQLGAAGAVFVNPGERLNDLIATTVWGTPSARDAHRIPRLPVAEVKRSDGDAIRARLADGTTRRVRMSARTKQGWKTLRMVVARVTPGMDASPNAPFVLFGGHIDAWYHGATDEGASNATMLELARAFHAQRAQLRRGLVVAWWPGHSNGRYAGSTWFADHHFSELRDRAIAYVNVDGIGQMGAKTFTAATTVSLSALATDVVRTRTGVTDMRVSRPGRDSDQSFNGIGLPLFQLNENRSAEDGGYWWWHTPDDTFDKIDFTVLKRDTDLYIDAIAALTSAAVPPIDAIAEVAALGAMLTQRQAMSGGRLDLTVAIARQARLLSLLREIQPRLATKRTGGDAGITLVRILRPVHRVIYTFGGEYHPDPAVAFGPLPGLSGARSLAGPMRDDDRGFTETSLVRETNRVVDALDEAIERAEGVRRDVRP